jgi:hypothetical protein
MGTNYCIGKEPGIARRDEARVVAKFESLSACVIPKPGVLQAGESLP